MLKHFPPIVMPMMLLFQRGSALLALRGGLLHRSTAYSSFNFSMSSLTGANTRSRSSTRTLIDVDCNLLHADLISVIPDNKDPLAILKHSSTVDAGIVGVLSPSSTLEESEKSVQLCSRLQNEDDVQIEVLTTVGVHPYHAAELPVTEQRLSHLEELALSGSAVVCIGECGLDYSEGFPDSLNQLEWFNAQLDLAVKLEKPLFLHERLAFEDFIGSLEKATNRNNVAELPPAVVHCFTGTRREAIEYIDRGFYIGITGFILKDTEGAEEVKTLLRDGLIPIEKIMIETDAPYLGFANSRDSFLEGEKERFTSLNSKKRKKLLKSTYPNGKKSSPSCHCNS